VEAAAQPFSLTQAYRGLGGLYLQQGRLDDAIPLLERCLVLCREADLPLAFPIAASYLGTAYGQAGRMGEALPLLEQALGRGATIRLGDRQTLRMILLGMGYLHQGRPQDALPLTQEALALARKRQERGVEGYAVHLRGAVAALGIPPDVAQAHEMLSTAIALFDGMEMTRWMAQARTVLSQLAG
jgi:tetratricopeptide (TPR) repeat protein